MICYSPSTAGECSEEGELRSGWRDQQGFRKSLSVEPWSLLGCGHRGGREAVCVGPIVQWEAQEGVGASLQLPLGDRLGFGFLSPPWPLTHGVLSPRGGLWVFCSDDPSTMRSPGLGKAHRLRVGEGPGTRPDEMPRKAVMARPGELLLPRAGLMGAWPAEVGKVGKVAGSGGPGAEGASWAHLPSPLVGWLGPFAQLNESSKPSWGLSDWYALFGFFH